MNEYKLFIFEIFPLGDLESDPIKNTKKAIIDASLFSVQKGFNRLVCRQLGWDAEVEFSQAHLFGQVCGGPSLPLVKPQGTGTVVLVVPSEWNESLKLPKCCRFLLATKNTTFLRSSAQLNKTYLLKNPTAL